MLRGLEHQETLPSGAASQGLTSVSITSNGNKGRGVEGSKELVPALRLTDMSVEFADT